MFLVAILAALVRIIITTIVLAKAAGTKTIMNTINLKTKVEVTTSVTIVVLTSHLVVIKVRVALLVALLSPQQAKLATVVADVMTVITAKRVMLTAVIATLSAIKIRVGLLAAKPLLTIAGSVTMTPVAIG